MNKHLLSTIAAAMLPIGMSSASIQSTSAYSYVGSRNDKNTTYAASSNASNVANKYAQQRTNENPLALKVNESADKLTAASLQQTLMAESELTLSTANNRANSNRANSNRAANNLTLNDQTSTALQNAQMMTVSGDLQSLQTVVQSNVTELIIIDAAVPDKHVFYQQLKPGVEIKEINSEQDGLLQLNEILSNYQNLSALHLVSHGDDGVIYLGNTQVNEQLLKEKVETFSALNNALKDDADLLLYGCNVAKTDKGESLLELIANESHIDVAASNNLTGNIANNADWNLEIAQGNINSKQLFNSNSMRDFSDILAVNDSSGTTITTNGFPNNGLGTTTLSYEPASGFNLTLASFNNSSAVATMYCNGGYCFVNGANISTTDTDELRVYFADGQEFNLDSIEVIAQGNDNTYVVTPDVGMAVDTLNVNTNSTFGAVSLNLTGIKSVSIKRNDGGNMAGFGIDNLVIRNAAAVPVNTAPTIGGITTTTTINDTATTLPFSAVTIADADGDNVAVTVTLDATAKGVFSLSSLSGSGFMDIGNNGMYVLNPTSAAAAQAAIRQLVFEPTDNRVAATLTENTTFTISVDDSTATAVTNSTTVVTSTSVNDAPTITDGVIIALANIDEEATSTAILVSDYLENLLTAYDDVDTATINGMAVTATTGTNWEYSTNGSSFTPFGTVSDVSALLLGGSDYIRFTGSSEYSGTTSLTFRGWDQTVGTQSTFLTPQNFDTTTNGGTTAFSTGTGELKFTVNPVNDTPTGIFFTATTLTESTTAIFADAGTLSSVDADSTSFTYSLVDYGNSTKNNCGFNDDPDNDNFIVDGTTIRVAKTLAGRDHYICVQTSDGNTSFDRALVVNVADDISPIISEVTPVGSPTSDTTPSLVFTTNEIGSLKVGGSCGTSQTTINAATGNLITLAQPDGTTPLAYGTYSDCTVIVTDAANNPSNTLTLSSFVVSPLPYIDSATYNSVTGTLVVDGDDFVSHTSFDVDASKITLMGENGDTYTLTDTGDREINNNAQFALNLSATDKEAVNGLFNKNGTISTGGATYNIAVADDFMAGATIGDTSDRVSNAVTVANVSAPTVTSASYNATTGVLDITGIDIPYITGGANDIDTSKFTITGEDSTSYNLVSSDDVERTSSTSVSIQLNSIDMTALAPYLNKEGAFASDTNAYNVAAAEDWARGADSAVVITDSINSLNVTNVPVPTITSVSYVQNTGVVTVNGSAFYIKSGSVNDIDISKFTFIGEAGNSYNITSTTDVDITSGTAFSFTLSGADKTEVDALLNLNGTQSSDAATYYLDAGENWNAGADSAVAIADTSLAISVSGWPTPELTSATYHAVTGALVVTGVNFEAKTGVSNDVDVSKLTLVGMGGDAESYTIVNAADVELDSATQFTVILADADKAAVDVILDKIGTTASNSVTYNLEAADDFITNRVAGDTSDTLNNPITVSNVAPIVTTPSAEVFVNNSTQEISGNYYTNGGVINIYLDANDDGIPDDGNHPINETTVASNAWSFDMPIQNDTIFNYVVSVSVGGSNQSAYINVPTINEDSTAPTDPVVTTPSAATNIATTSYAISGTHSEDGVTVSLYADSDNDGVADDAVVIASDVVESNVWSVDATLKADSENSYVVIASDKANNVSGTIDLFVLTHMTPNSAPTISGTTATSFPQGTVYSFKPTVADVDSGDKLTVSINKVPSWANFVDGVLFGTTSGADVGTTTDIIITVTDKAGATASLPPFSLTVTDLNDNPVISGTPITSVAQGVDYTFTPVVTDVDGEESTTFSINTKPAWAEFSTLTGTLNGTPSSTDIGTTANIIITVADKDGATDSLAAFSLTVTNVNDAPVISGTPITSVAQGVDYTFTPVVTDVDGEETTTFSIVNQPAWADFSTLTGTLNGTPSSEDIGTTVDIVITVADKDGATDSLAAFSIEVVEAAVTFEAVDDAYEFSRNDDNTYVLDVLANDTEATTETEAENSGLTITASSTSIGSVAIESNQLVLTVDDGFVGAVDLNYSISNSKEEFSEANVSVVITGAIDSLNVIVAPSDVEVNATGLYTPVDLGVATATNETGDSIAVSLVGTTLFAPGNNIAYWETAVEGAEPNVTVSQKVVVHPLVSLSKDQMVVEGSTATVRVLLNGEAPVYPLTIPFSVSGSVDADDYVISVDSVDIESGTQAVITISIVDDGVTEIDETLTITLGDVNKGSQFVHTMTITESNIVPTIEIALSQDDELRQVITPVDGLVTISANVYDVNGDTGRTEWNYGSDIVVVEEDSQLVFDPSTLTPGTYSVSLSAIEESRDDGLTSVESIYFSVVSELAVLTTADTDGDLIPDNQEGYSDTDKDGIPDYLDAISECNVIPQQVGNQDAYLVEGDAGICLRLGNTLADGETGGLQLTESELAAFTGESDTASNVGGIFDYIATGLPVIGQDYHIVLPQRQPIPTNALYRKYNAAAGWTSFVEDADNQLHSTAGQAGYCPPPSSDLWTTGLTEGHWCVQLTIVDGGPNDDDGLANGTIVDPGGVGVVASDNTAPVAINDSVSVKVGESIIIDVLANDVDAQGDELTLGVVTASLGTVTVTSDNQIEYQTAANFVGTDVVTYTVSDGQGGTTSATVNVDVFVNAAPVAVEDAASTDDRTAITIDVLSNDTDSDSDVLSVLSASVDVGSVVVNSDSSLTFTPEFGFDGVATISYALTDGVNNSVLGMVNIQVTALETVTVENESKGGNMGVMMLFMAALAAFRAKSRLNVKTRSASMLAVLVGLCSFNTSASESDGWFVSGAIGQSTVIEHIDTSDVSYVTGVSYDDSDTSFHFGVGYKFTDYSITLGYELLGDTNASITGDTLDAVQYQEALLEVAPILVDGLSLGGQYNVWRNEMFTVSLGLGILMWDLDYESRVQDEVVLVDDSGVDLFYKLQAGYQINDKVAVNLQATRYNLPYNDVTNIAVGVTYQF